MNTLRATTIVALIVAAVIVGIRMLMTAAVPPLAPASVKGPEAASDASRTSSAQVVKTENVRRSVTAIRLIDAWATAPIAGAKAKLAIGGDAFDLTTSGSGQVEIEWAKAYSERECSIRVAGFTEWRGTVQCEGFVAVMQPERTIDIRIVGSDKSPIVGLAGQMRPLGQGRASEFVTDKDGIAVRALTTTCAEWIVEAQEASIVEPKINIGCLTSDDGKVTVTIVAEVIPRTFFISGKVTGIPSAEVLGLRVRANGRTRGEAACDADGAFLIRPSSNGRMDTSEDGMNVVLLLLDDRNRRLHCVLEGRNEAVMKVRWGSTGHQLKAVPLEWAARTVKVVYDENGSAVQAFRVTWIEESSGAAFSSSKSIETMEVSSLDGRVELRCIKGRSYCLSIVPGQGDLLGSGIVRSLNGDAGLVVRLRRPSHCLVMARGKLPEGESPVWELVGSMCCGGARIVATSPLCDLNKLIEGGFGGALGIRYSSGQLIAGEAKLTGDPANLVRLRFGVPGSTSESTFGLSEPFMLPAVVDAEWSGTGWKCIVR